MNRRRTLLRALGLGCAGALAGCSALGDGDAGDEASTTAPATTSAGGRSTTEPATATATSTVGPTTTDGAGTTTVDVGERSHFALEDGFATVAPWLEAQADAVTVARVTEPTRAALAQAVSGSGPRVVVFETSGTIDLGGERQHLTITDDRTWIAGQTAPSPGITLVRGGLSIDASHCVVQHLRCRAGDAGHEPGSRWEPDSLRTGDRTRDNVIDHCTATWGVDETLSVGFDVSDTTVTNCLVAEALHASTHSEGRHGFGSIGAGGDSRRVAWLGTLWSRNSGRNPRLGGTGHLVVNTVADKFERAAGLDRNATASFVGNVYLRPGDRPIRGQGSDDDITRVYVEDNVVEGYSVTNQPYIELLEEPPTWPEGLTALPSSVTVSHDLAHAGARPADRTTHDQRILEHVRQGSGEYVDSQEAVGGYPELSEHSRTLDVPETGLRDWLAEHAAAVETRAAE